MKKQTTIDPRIMTATTEKSKLHDIFCYGCLFGCAWINKSVTSLTLACLCLLTLTACVESVRNAIPFLPPPKYVEVTGGRRLKRSEIAMLEREKALLAAIRVNPKDAVAYTGLGDLYQKIGWYRRAKDRYRDAIDNDPTLSQPHYSLGLLCIYEDRFGEAFDELKKAQALSPDDARIHHRLGQAAAGVQEIDKALKSYDEAIILDAEYTPAYLEKAKLLYSLRRYAEAASLCRSALTHVPKVDVSSVAKVSRGNSLLDRFLPTGQEEEPPKTYRAEAAYDLALCLKAQGQFRDALAVLAQAEEVEPAKADVQILKSRLLEAGGDVPGALATLQPLRQAFPNMAEIPKRIAKLHQKSGQTELAAKIRLEAAELDHSDRELQEEAARNAEQNHDVARAIAIYERLVRVDPEELRYRRILAKASTTPASNGKRSTLTRRSSTAVLKILPHAADWEFCAPMFRDLRAALCCGLKKFWSTTPRTPRFIANSVNCS